MFSLRATFSVFLGLSVFLVAGVVRPAAAAEIVPHRAGYVLTMKDATRSSGVSDVRGVLTFELTESCEAWAVEHRMRLSIVYRGDQTLEMQTDYNSTESKDGLSYTFESGITRGPAREVVSGSAALPAAGEKGVALMTAEEKRRVELPPGTLFPMAHTAKVLASAEAGEKLLWALVFDGTTDDGLYEVNAVIGASEPATSVIKSVLAQRPAWPLTLAYFPFGRDASEPEYELTTRVNDVGVAYDMIMDFGGFSLNARLQTIEALPRPSC